jgi:hypothetical protein
VTGRARPWRRLALNTLLVLGSGVLALGLVDLLLILTNTPAHRPIWEAQGLFRLDRELIYSLIPGGQRVWRTGEFAEQATINRQGLRGAELREPRPAGERIIVTGDSVVFGHGVGDGETFPKRLEAIFASEGRDVEVLNAGVKGYGTDQSLRYFELRLEPLRPDVLVFAVNANDVADNIRQPLYTVRDGRLRELDATRNPFYRVVWLESHLPGIVRRTDLYRRLVTRLLRADWNGTLPDRDPARLEAWSRDKIVLEIERLRDRSREAGFRLVVLGLPGPAPHAFRWLQARLPEGVAFLDANEAESWTSEPSRWFLNDRIHLTVAGNERLARLLHAYLLDTGRPVPAP